MKIIYIHHANRKKGNPPSKNDDITRLGTKDAKLVEKLLYNAKKAGMTIKTIYSSPFLRCAKTAKIINKRLKLPIVFDQRLNEKGSVPNESWLDLQKRVRDCIKDAVKDHKNQEAAICVTSGVNVAAFISLANKQKPSKNAAYIGVPNCCPLVFDIDESSFN